MLLYLTVKCSCHSDIFRICHQFGCFWSVFLEVSGDLENVTSLFPTPLPATCAVLLPWHGVNWGKNPWLASGLQFFQGALAKASLWLKYGMKLGNKVGSSTAAVTSCECTSLDASGWRLCLSVFNWLTCFIHDIADDLVLNLGKMNVAGCWVWILFV